MDHGLQRLRQPRDLDTIDGGTVATNLQQSTGQKVAESLSLCRRRNHRAEVVGIVSRLENQTGDDAGADFGAVDADLKPNIALK